MTSVEKRRSGRKSGKHRKPSDGGYSDTSSGGSFLDETDREVSSLTDRAFRSLCIGDEAVYNDSDLCSSSPCSQRDRQLAFSQGGQDRHRRDGEGGELKRAAHESFTVRVQQYGQDWMHGGMYGAEIQRDPQWEAYGETTQGRVSATFQHSFVETSQQEKSLRADQLSFFSNGATDLRSQQRRSRSRVSSLIRAFNSDGHRDGAGMDGKLREWNNDTSWDNSALMNIQRQLSEFSSSYQQNFNSDPFLTAGPFMSQNTGFYSSEVAAVNCNSNFFIHSEFSPFKVWRDHNRFPFQREVSGFMHCSEFPKWYETPMYRQPSQEARPQGPFRFEEGGIGNLRNNMVPMVPTTPQRSTSTSTMLQKAPAVEKRCESELAGHYPHRKRIQSLGANKLPSQRPSTASPTIEMSRRVRDTISSVKALQQKIKMMAEQNMEVDMEAFGHSAETVAANAVRGNTTPLNMSQLLTPSVHAHQEARTSVVQQGAASPQLVEHAPVRAESRGATPDIRMSGYRSRASSLLFNLKDNRKRVKNTYSPTKFKQPSTQEPRDTVIDIPDYPEHDIQFTQVEEFSRTSAASHPYVNQYQNPGLSLATRNSHPKTSHAGQYLEYTSGDYQTAQRQSEMAHHSAFTGFTPENYTTSHLANGQYLHEDFPSFNSYKQSVKVNAESLVGNEYRHQPSYTATEAPRNTVSNQTREYFASRANAEQHFNETVGRESTKVDRYQQLKDNKHDYSNVSTQDRWRQTNSQDTERLGLRAAVSPWKQEITASTEKEQHAQAYQRAAQMKEELHSLKDTHRGRNQQSVNAEMVNTNISNQLPQYGPELGNDSLENQRYYGQYPPATIRDNCALQKQHGNDEENEMQKYLAQYYDGYTDPENPHQHMVSTSKDKTMYTQETAQRKQYVPVPKGNQMQSLQPVQATPPLEHSMPKNALSNPENEAESTIVLNQVQDRQLAEVKAGQATAEIAKTELAIFQRRAQVEPPRADSVGLNLAGQTGSEKLKAEQAKAEVTEHQRVYPSTTEEKKKEEQTEKIREKLPEPARDQTKAREQKITEEPKNIKEEAAALHMKEEQGEQVKAEQAREEKLKEEHIKTELVQTEQTTQARREEEERVRAEQIERERKETERTATEKIKTEQAKQEQQAKSEQETMLRMEKFKVKDVEEQKLKVDSVKVCVHAEPTIPELNKVKEPKVGKQIKVDLAKAELTKTQDLQERFVKSGGKLIAKQVRSEPDKVKQVKSELAKAKAELAKIKGKMKGEQNIRNINIFESDSTKKDNHLNINMNKKEDYKNQDGATQLIENSLVTKSVRDQVNRGADDYDSLRGKYGFTHTCSPNDAKAKATISPSAAETVKHNKPNDHLSPASELVKANTENKEGSRSLKSNEETESQYVYSETSKEFKLSGSDNLPNLGDNCDTITNVKDDSNEKLGKREDARVADSDLTKPGPLEQKPKSVQHSAAPRKDCIPPRALTHKERAQTKQEILTSKIKAHAEKEISAIKEKGFAIRDGFISKNPMKQLAGSQSLHIRQRPPSQEVSKKQESTMSSNITPNPQMEPSGVQTAKSVPTPTSTSIPVKSAATTSQLGEHVQKQVTKDPMKRTDNVQEPTTDVTQEQITGRALVDKKNVSLESGVKSPVAPVDNSEKQKTNHGANPGKQKDGVKDNPVISKDQQKKEKEDLSKLTPPVKAESSNPVTSEKPVIKCEEEDSAPSINIFSHGQNKTPATDDSLQIMGIMVTVRERKKSESDNTNQKLINTKAKEQRISELDKSHPSSGLEVNSGKYHPKDNSKTKEKDRVAQEVYPTEKEDNTNVRVRNEIVQENLPKKVPVKETNLQKTTAAKSQREMQLQEPLADKVVPSTVTAPPKNKELSETQPLLHKKDIKDKEKNDNSNKKTQLKLAKDLRKDEEKNNVKETNDQKTATAYTNDNFKAREEKLGIKNDAVALVKPYVQVPSSEDVTAVVNPSKAKSIDGEGTTQMGGKRNDLTPVKPLNKTTPSQHLPEKQNNHISPRVETNTQVDDDVHIDNISIRVVPSCAATKNNSLNIAGKNEATVVPAGVVVSTEHKEVVSLTSGEKLNSSANNDKIKDLTPEDKYGVQYVLSSVKKLSDSLKISKQKDSIKVATENTQAERQMSDEVKNSRNSVDQAKAQVMDGDYFQVQGIGERGNDLHNSANKGDTLGGVSNERIPPASLNKTSVDEEVKNDAIASNQTKRKTESSIVGVRNANVEKKNREPQQSIPTERQEVGQANHFRKSSLSARERQSSRNSRDNAAQEKTDVKPKPKERVSAIPEISALADYARLKVIVSEEQENTIQEFPPNKKEGFFPLIQSRHSRRPVFTDDSKDISVKEKHLPNKTEMSVKANKEPKALVFPITEKEHQRTGMFKLGDKDKQEKKVLEAPNVSDVGANCVKEENKSLKTDLKQQTGVEPVSGCDALSQMDQSVPQPVKPAPQTATSTSAANETRNTTALQHLKSPVDSSRENDRDLSSKLERTSFSDRNSQPTLGVIQNLDGSKSLRKQDNLDNRVAKSGEERPSQGATNHEESVKQSQEEQVSRIEEMRIKHIIEESRASLAEEERRAMRREEERRAKEREAIASRIKERREKQREADKKLEKERKEKQGNNDRAAEEEIRATQKGGKEKEIKSLQSEDGRRAKLVEEADWPKDNEKRMKQQEKGRAEEQQRRAAQEEQKSREALIEEQQRKAALEEQQRKAAHKEQQRRAAHEEQQKKAAYEEQKRRAALIEEQQKRAAQEEQQRRAAQEEQQRRAAQEEQQRRAALEEQQKKAEQEEQQRRAEQEEQQRRAAQEEQQRRAAHEEQQKKAEQEQQQRRAAQEEQQRRAALEEQQKKAEQEQQQRRAAHEEQQKSAKQWEEKRLAEIEQEKIRTQREEEYKTAADKDKTIMKLREQKQAKEERTRHVERSQAEEEQIVQREDKIMAKNREEEALVSQREKEKAAQMEEQKRAAQMVDALQYYAISSKEPERKPKDRPLRSPLPSQQNKHPSVCESPEDSGYQTRSYRSPGSASPAPSLPRSNTSSPALGAKPSMFRVKDNTMRASPFKSVKPRFHKNFGDDFRVGSPMERVSEQGEQEQETMRHRAGGPAPPDTGLNRHGVIKQTSSQDYSAYLPQHRPYSRRSLVLEDDDSRSLMSNMSEDVESFATSAADLADIRGLYDHDRPESACSYSSDASRSVGKPPVVPPKSEKALRRAQRLTTRRIKKELGKAREDNPAGVEQPPQEGPRSSNEVHSSSKHAVASPHFSSPVSLAHAPAMESGLPPSHTEHTFSQHSVHTSPHASGPVSLPVPSPHAAAAVILPVTSPHAAGPASHTAALKTVSHVSSSPTLHLANHPAPVTQYHVESGYPQSYPMTQRKVLQDLGSGQYFVVDVPVQVKTKTFFDPQTGKYVQLNVRESGKSASQPQPQFLSQTKSQPISQASPTGKPLMLYQGYHGYSPGYQPAAVNSMTPHSSSAPVTPQQNQQPVRENYIYGYPAPDIRQYSEGHRYSPEKTPYMDTVNDKEKTYNTVYNTHGSHETLPECDTNSQLAGSSGVENENSAPSRYQRRDIITIGELEDFMEVSDW